MTRSIFYSWQSDLPNSTNRNLIEGVIYSAIKIITLDLVMDEPDRDNDLTLDKDTKGIPGTPPIVDVIFKKISSATVFIPDLTFVGVAENGRMMPNPNVLIEYGWALSTLGYSKIIPIMNTTYGVVSSETLPFDMKHLRHPITYTLDTNTAPKEKAGIKEKLVNQVVEAIKLVLANVPKEKSLESGNHVVMEPTVDPSTFLKINEPLGLISEFRKDERKLVIPGNQHLFLRVIPTKKTGNIRNSKDALDLIRKGNIKPMGHFHRSWNHNRNKYGAFTYSHEDSIASGVTQLFLNNELWGIDSDSIDKEKCMELVEVGFGYFPCVLLEDSFNYTLATYLKFCKDMLQLNLPLKIIAGATNVEGYRMTPPSGMHFGGYSRFSGRVYDENIIYETEILDYDSTASSILRPFFNQIWNACGLDRPDKEAI